MQGNIFDYLKPGEDNAITTAGLMELTGLSERSLRSQIAKERRAGALILSKKSTGGGYFAPTSPEEAQKFARMMESEAKAMFAASKAARIHGKSIKGQFNLNAARDGA